MTSPPNVPSSSIFGNQAPLFDSKPSPQWPPQPASTNSDFSSSNGGGQQNIWPQQHNVTTPVNNSQWGNPWPNNGIADRADSPNVANVGWPGASSSSTGGHWPNSSGTKSPAVAGSGGDWANWQDRNGGNANGVRSPPVNPFTGKI